MKELEERRKENEEKGKGGIKRGENEKKKERVGQGKGCTVVVHLLHPRYRDLLVYFNGNSHGGDPKGLWLLSI